MEYLSDIGESTACVRVCEWMCNGCRRVLGGALWACAMFGSGSIAFKSGNIALGHCKFTVLDLVLRARRPWEQRTCSVFVESVL